MNQRNLKHNVHLRFNKKNHFISFSVLNFLTGKVIQKIKNFLKVPGERGILRFLENSLNERIKEQ